jgi:hypothetical protein
LGWSYIAPISRSVVFDAAEYDCEVARIAEAAREIVGL